MASGAVHGGTGRDGSGRLPGRRAALVLPLALLATPALAESGDSADPTEPAEALMAAMYHCQQQGRDPEALAATLRDAGWTVERNEDAGSIDFTPATSEVWGMASLAGDFCMVAIETLGTPITVHAIMQFLPPDAPTEPSGYSADLGCPYWTISPGVNAELTSSGNDPVCEDYATSAVRFTFNP